MADNDKQYYTVTVWSSGGWVVCGPSGLVIHEGISVPPSDAEKAARDWVKQHKANRKTTTKLTKRELKIPW